MMTRLQYLLVKLAEEASEVSQIALKTAQFGLEETYTDKTNQKRVHDELHDLFALVHMLNTEYNFGFLPDILERDKKIAKVNQYANYSKSLGMIDGPYK